MPLRLNLYHELHLRKKQKAYDPLKISILVLIVTASVMAVYYFSILRRKTAAASTLKNHAAEYKLLEEEERLSIVKEAELSAQKTSAEILLKRMEERFYWPALLEDISKTISPKIQIQRLSAEVGKESNRKVTVTAEGIIASPEHPRLAAGDFLNVVLDKFSAKYKKENVTARFPRLEDSPNTITVDRQELKLVNYSLFLEFTTPEPPLPAVIAKKK